jgi:predicted pyridoxine 5'-phosphate oxidase superfamily flavin-nucleotide-binding protein
MSTESELLRSKWEARQGVPILTTVDADGKPNTIYFTIGDFFDERTFFVADNYFAKTRKNILNGTYANILFLTPDRNSYQLKGPIRFETEGPIFDAMKYINPSTLPGRAAAVIDIEFAYSGSKVLVRPEID